MIALIQRVKEASVNSNQQTISSISKGLLAFIAIEPHDNRILLEKLAYKILNYRVFPDNNGNMNFSLLQTQTELLLVPQFTLAADTKRGLRPGFSNCSQPVIAVDLFTQLVQHIKDTYSKTYQGNFGEDMDIHLINEGPATFWLQV
jgi:D-tyrosyl-tRNA(Tyr) deacylase